MNQLFQKMKGYKTYVIAVLMVIFAVSGVIIGKMSMAEAIQLLLNAAGLAGLRHAVEPTV